MTPNRIYSVPPAHQHRERLYNLTGIWLSLAVFALVVAFGTVAGPLVQTITRAILGVL